MAVMAREGREPPAMGVNRQPPPPTVTAREPKSPRRITMALVDSAPAVARPPPSTATLTLQENTQALLDRAHQLVLAGQPLPAFRLLGTPLSALWSEARACGLAEAMRQWCRAHALHALVREDPYTERAATKPRGYAGDAVMMDYIYSGQPPEGTSELGRTIFGATTRVSMGLSVLYRRQLLKSQIDDVVVTREGGRILSVASGHARELEGSLVQSPLFAGEVVALDQDPLSCNEVQRVHGSPRVRVLHQGVRDLLAKPADELGRFDLVYSAGLYDYLPDILARRLTVRLAQLLAPGGRLLIANFVPGGSGRGYMELFMDWTLVLRDEAQMLALLRAADPEGQGQISSFLDPHRNVVYAELQRGLAP
jgi:extracellular factor (EF) 3-hydroxypalmitic acid methyl ester biosynthesis protein